jgi:hypothetical protein
VPPYGSDEVLEAYGRQYRENLAYVRRLNALALEQRLAMEFKVPPEFMDLAVKIWWNGKED